MENVAYAYLDPDVYELLLEQTHRRASEPSFLARSSTHYSRSSTGVARAHQTVSNAEDSLHHDRLGEDAGDDYARSIAFRRVVLRAYDYRCAACGLKIVLPDLPSPVEAAHLVPSAVSQTTLLKMAWRSASCITGPSMRVLSLRQLTMSGGCRGC